LIEGPVKIAMVGACPFPCPRGTPIRILRLAEALAGRGHEVHVVTYHLAVGEAPPCLHVHRIPRIATYRRLAPGPSYQMLLVLDPLLTAKLRAVIRRHDIDVIHAHHYEGLVTGAIARGSARLPLIYDAHTLLGPELSTYALGLPAWLVGRFGRGLDRVLPRLADRSIAVSEAIARSLVADAGLPAEQYRLGP
jgi:glycosyltransferase involved in cell wall biosynthesis